MTTPRVYYDYERVTISFIDYNYNETGGTYFYKRTTKGEWIIADYDIIDYDNEEGLEQPLKTLLVFKEKYTDDNELIDILVGAFREGFNIVFKYDNDTQHKLHASNSSFFINIRKTIDSICDINNDQWNDWFKPIDEIREALDAISNENNGFKQPDWINEMMNLRYTLRSIDNLLSRQSNSSFIFNNYIKESENTKMEEKEKIFEK
jgi:hypothetical protein